MDALESIRKHLENIAQNLENYGFGYIQNAGDTHCCIQWTCSYRIMYLATTLIGTLCHPDRDMSHVSTVSSNFFTKLRTLIM